MPKVIKVACATALPPLLPATTQLPAATATATGGVVHGPTRAQLDPAHAQRIIGITDTGDRGLIALRACQAFINEIRLHSH